MALLPPLTSTNLSFADLRTAYNSSSTLTDIRLGDYSRNAQYVPSYTTLNNVPAVSGTTIIANNTDMSGFRSGRVSSWVYRDSLKTLGLGLAFTATDSVVIYRDIWNNNTSTLRALKGSLTVSSQVIDPVPLILGSGSISVTYTTSTGSLSQVMTANGMTNVNRAAFNSRIGIFAVSGPQGHLIWNATGGSLAWSSSPSFKAIMDASSTFFRNCYLACWGNYIFALKSQASLNPGGTSYLATIAYTSDGANWSSYTVDMNIAAFNDLVVLNDRLVVFGSANFVGSGASNIRTVMFESSDPTNPASWTQKTSITTLFGSVGTSWRLGTAAYNNGVWVAGGTFGRIVRSTTGGDDYVDVTGPNSLRSNEGSYWWNQNSNGSISKIIAYRTGFLAFGNHYRSTAWSPDGLNWYYGLGNRNIGDTTVQTTGVQDAHYDPTLDRVYMWQLGGGYSRNDGNDLQFTLDGVNFFPES